MGGPREVSGRGRQEGARACGPTRAAHDPDLTPGARGKRSQPWPAGRGTPPGSLHDCVQMTIMGTALATIS